eukprot:scaffold3502_cov183-Amphora_coffeaeformis.AAC.7
MSVGLSYRCLGFVVCRREKFFVPGVRELKYPSRRGDQGRRVQLQSWVPTMCLIGTRMWRTTGMAKNS